ncbi:MAG TPA: pyrroloquinoline quinone biosynthesis peptide chaperone PqqD [Devosiaceae bacterium]|nr:pyrroloquinoline quinone biosynthesis peptide chaperone PqqD [Devosiaceae bacterium]
MAQTAARHTTAIGEDARPVLRRHAQLRFDSARQRWVLLVPERVLVPDDTAVEVLQLCDGRSVADIVDTLAGKYNAARNDIGGDVVAMLQDLAEKGFLMEAGEERQ